MTRPERLTSRAATAEGYDTIQLYWGALSTAGTPTGYRIDVLKDTLRVGTAGAAKLQRNTGHDVDTHEWTQA